MLSGKWRGQDLGSGTAHRRYWNELRAGRISQEAWCEIESCIFAESWALQHHGHSLHHDEPGGGFGHDASGLRQHSRPGLPAALHRGSQRPADGGNGQGGLAPIAHPHTRGFPERHNRRHGHRWLNQCDHSSCRYRRAAGIDIPLAKFDESSRRTPVLANIEPSGQFLMEDFFYAGGLPVVMKEIKPLLHLDALTVTGKTARTSLRRVL